MARNFPNDLGWGFLRKTAKKIFAASAPWRAVLFGRHHCADGFISPYRRDRDAVRAKLKPGDFIEVFVDAPIEVCEKRDPKGLYKKARAGELKGFTGIDDPYEAPEKPELRLDAAAKDAETLADEVIAYLKKSGKLK